MESSDPRFPGDVVWIAAVYPWLGDEVQGSFPRTAVRAAAAALREGFSDTLTLTRLGIVGSLRRTLESTNPMESMIELIRDHSTRLARLLEQIMGRPLEITHGNRRPGDVDESQLANDRIRQLGWSPRVSLADGPRQLLKPQYGDA